jgi:hypothetical protein
MPAALPLPTFLHGDPHQWRTGTLDRDALYAAADQVASHPAHLEAARGLAGAVLGVLDRNPLARRVMHDAPMYLMLACCMALEHRRRTQGAEGITLQGLRGLFYRGQAPRLAGDSHLRDMLGWARVCGLLAPDPGPGLADRRMRRLRPTPALEAIFTEWIARFTASIAPVLPPPWRDGEPTPAQVYAVMSLRIAAFTQDAFVANERHPIVQRFMSRRHGYHVFLALLEQLHPTPEGGQVRVSISGLSQRFHVARGTIRAVLELAQSERLLAFDRASGIALLSPDFIRLARSWMAVEMCWMHGVCRAVAG